MKRSPFCIRVATNAGELTQIFTFRYRIYVEEMHRKQKDADHQRKVIQDSLDQHAVNIAAFSGNDVVGVVRLNFLTLGAAPFYEDLYRTSQIGPASCAGKVIVTRLMVAPHLRKSTLAARLCIACYTLGLSNGTRWGFLDCNSHLIAFFTGLGFRPYIGTVLHEEYGEVTPMVLDLLDGAHLSAVRSPFFDAFSTWLKRSHQANSRVAEEPHVSACAESTALTVV